MKTTVCHLKPPLLGAYLWDTCIVFSIYEDLRKLLLSAVAWKKEMDKNIPARKKEPAENILPLCSILCGKLLIIITGLWWIHFLCPFSRAQTLPEMRLSESLSFYWFIFNEFVLYKDLEDEDMEEARVIILSGASKH